VYQRVAHHLEKAGLRRLELLICNSRAVLERVARAHAIPRSRLRVTYLAVPTEVHRGDVPVTENPTLFFAGGNFQRKGLEVVLRAMPELTRRWRGLELRVAGRDRSERAMTKLAAELGVGDQVTFLGWVSPARIRMEMRGASVFVMPSWEEGFGLVYLEAMQAGVPVVGGNVGGTRELISNGCNGFTVPAGDHLALAARLGQLIEDGSLRKEFVAEGFKTVATLTPRALARSTERVYREVLARWGG
jgi:glycosyltransferase involved in cell wall biosynthesis